jgi:hypothetical protein
MRAVVQRAGTASVEVAGQAVGRLHRVLLSVETAEQYCIDPHVAAWAWLSGTGQVVRSHRPCGKLLSQAASLPMPNSGCLGGIHVGTRP